MPPRLHQTDALPLPPVTSVLSATNVDWPVAKVGAHYFEFAGTGSVVAVQDAVFTARAGQTA